MKTPPLNTEHWDSLISYLDNSADLLSGLAHIFKLLQNISDVGAVIPVADDMILVVI